MRTTPTLRVAFYGCGTFANKTRIPNLMQLGSVGGFIMADETVTQRIYDALKNGYFNAAKDYVDVSNGSGDDVEIVVVSRKFKDYNRWRRVDIIWKELEKHLPQEEADRVFLSIGMLPEDVKML